MAIEVTTFEQIATILSQLATNYSNIFTQYYNLFYNPVPMDVNIQVYDDAGNLQNITIPNRAKDRTYVLNGNGSPEGTLSAPLGSIYQDLLSGNVYVKRFDVSSSSGWFRIVDSAKLEEYIIQGFGSPEGLVSSVKGTIFIDKENALLYIKNTSTGNSGWKLLSPDTSVLADIDLDNLTEKGEGHFANPSLTNLSLEGQALIDSKEEVDNKVVVVDSNSNDKQYPSARSVYTLVSTSVSDKATRDLDNLTSTGEEHFVGKPQIKDCILSAPNGVASINSNVISVPAGMILLGANGRSSDFKMVNLRSMSQFSSISISWVTKEVGLVFYDCVKNNIKYCKESLYFEQDTAPDTSDISAIWYSPRKNTYATYSSSSSTWSETVLVQVAKFTTNSLGIVQTFNPTYPLTIATEIDVSKKADITLVNTKADINLANTEPTADFVSVVYGRLTPDYSRGKGVSSGYTATEPGWFCWVLQSGGLYFRSCYINGQRVGVAFNTYGDRTGGGNAFVPVNTGDTITFDAGSATFYPINGEV